MLPCMLTIGSIVIRVDDMARQIVFWTQALDYVVREPAEDEFTLLKPRAGNSPNVSLAAVSTPRALPPKIHLDLYADDQTAEVDRLEALGATRIRWDRQPPDADFVIMEDPEGNRFCVVDCADEFVQRAGSPAHRQETGSEGARPVAPRP